MYLIVIWYTYYTIVSEAIREGRQIVLFDCPNRMNVTSFVRLA